MSKPVQILSTKLHIPPRAQVVARPHLIKQLDAGLSRRLTLLSAPAGSGKSTLISEWVAQCRRPVAWLSLDEGDSDPVSFLTYVVAALETVAPSIGERMGSLLQSPQPPPVQSLMTTLINEIASLPAAFILVLDDYHILDNDAINQAVAFLIEHLPAQMHLVIITREDPPLPLARLRARGQLTELRAADLRFSPDESAEFLNHIMHLNLSEADIARLETRTEGWIAGLQLAALSMQGQDIDTFIQSFTGTHHFVLDYLVEEVLHQQSERIQTFLLHTSILDRVCGALCDAVLQDNTCAGQETLENIQQANLFLVPLDNERRWYRYHHLFGELLRQRLHQKLDASGIDELHRRASQWYEDNGFDVPAFHHATLANDIERAERLIEGAGMPLYFRGAATPVLHWLDSLPAAIFDTRPSLAVIYASVMTILGYPAESVEMKMQVAEAALQNTGSGDRTRDLIGQIAAMRAMLAVPQGQIDTIITQSYRALEYLHPDNLPVRTGAAWTLGLARQLQGDHAAAHQAYTEALSISEASGNTMIIVAAATGLGQVLESENRLHQAAEAFRRVLQVLGDPPPPYVCEALVGLARISYQWNDLDSAERYTHQSLDLAQQLANVDTPAACGVLLVRVNLARGATEAASAVWSQTERFVHQNHFLHWLPEVTTAHISVLLQQGNLTAAAHLAQELPLAQARVLLAQGNPSAALMVLEPLRHDAETRDRAADLLKVMILQALALQALDETDSAVQVMSEALALAKPGGIIRAFADEGLPMAELLAQTADRGIMPTYTAALLTAFEMDTGSIDYPAGFHPDLIEPLTLREYEVLKLIATGYSNPDIADELVIAVTTVKTHVKNIYGKLQVDNRFEAINRARDLKLV